MTDFEGKLKDLEIICEEGALCFQDVTVERKWFGELIRRYRKRTEALEKIATVGSPSGHSYIDDEKEPDNTCGKCMARIAKEALTEKEDSAG